MTDYGSGRGTCRCGAAWSGHRLAHCAGDGCHRTFGSAALFTRHLRSNAGDQPSSHVDLTEKLTRSGAAVAVLAPDGVIREPWRGHHGAVTSAERLSQKPRDQSPHHDRATPEMPGAA